MTEKKHFHLIELHGAMGGPVSEIKRKCEICGWPDAASPGETLENAMNLILEAEGVKRELNAPFNMCLSAKDLDALREQLDRIAAVWQVRNVSYGWVRVYPIPEGAGVNSVPRPWAE